LFHSKSISRRSNSLILLDNTIISSSVNSTLVESPKPVGNDSFNKLDQTVVVDHSTNIKSVKEHAKKLNRLNTESELKHLNFNSNEMSSKPINKAAVDLNDSSSSARFKVNRTL